MIAGLEILNLHAQGGMAEVYRARGKGADGQMWTYAVKRILPEYTADPELRKMFAEEARIASLLVHPNIVRVYDLARSENDEFFIVMEFLEGRDLAEAVDKANELERKLPIWLAVHCAREVLASLVYATTQARDREGNLLGLIHRDISPHNIFVTWDGQVKLTDFGVAKVQQSNVLTQVGVTKGKFGYMSPEQLTSSGLDFRSDLFNVGILLYEIITARRLFWGETPSSFLQAMIRGEVPPIDPLLRVPPDLEDLMRRALSRERDERPATAAAFDGELATIQARHRLTVDASHVEMEWRGLFGAEAIRPEPQSAPASAPRRLASINAALPEVVARAEVPSVRPTTARATDPPQARPATARTQDPRDGSPRPQELARSEPSSRANLRPGARPPALQVTPASRQGTVAPGIAPARAADIAPKMEVRAAAPASPVDDDGFTHERTVDEAQRLEKNLHSRIPDAPRDASPRAPRVDDRKRARAPTKELLEPEPRRDDAAPRAVQRVRAPVPEEDPRTLPPSDERHLGNLPSEPEPATDPKRAPHARPTIAKGAGPNAVMLSVEESWDDDEAQTEHAPARKQPPAPHSVITGSAKVVALPAKRSSSSADTKKPKR